MAVNTTCECRNSISVTKTRVTGKVHFRHPKFDALKIVLHTEVKDGENVSPGTDISFIK